MKISDLIEAAIEDTYTLTLIGSDGTMYRSEKAYISAVARGDPIAKFSMSDHEHGRRVLSWCIELRGQEDLGAVDWAPDLLNIALVPPAKG